MALTLSLLSARGPNLLAPGDDTAAGLGIRVARIAAAGRARRARIALGLGALPCAGVAPVLMSGPALTPPLELLRVLAGGDVPGASFAVRELRLPRAVLAALAGMGFGLDLGPADDPVAGPAPDAGQRATRPASEEPAPGKTDLAQTAPRKTKGRPLRRGPGLTLAGETSGGG
ncbi:hypothetical protein BV509_09465 [Rhodovulum sulfidophilum]|uniref:hypothetical protein n=1 Tax=Rhodovulum visakhapatnamense TaxID=364297 RepID=UPI000952540E|nr:hypothetical protein [Rhodovulum visakhapatnamense]OLS44544.1 hypothetical protein BV509_09465 [Rhodovulum sulfidophilum]